MATQHTTILIYCESSLHAGAGQGVGTIDLPIQRERHTGFPKIEASALRGAVREAVWEYHLSKNRKGGDEKELNVVFGNKNDGDKRSALDIGDARLIFFPVRSWKGVFAWITCPYVLNRFIKDMALPDKVEVSLQLPVHENNNEIFVSEDSIIKSSNKVMLEEYVFNVPKSQNGNTAILINHEDPGTYFFNRLSNNRGSAATELIFSLTDRWALVTDEVFRDFVEMYTEKITRNKINSNTGTADDGGLFNEEFLPTESILYAYVGATDEFSIDNHRKSAKEIMELFRQNLPDMIQVGGDANIGKGLVRVNLL